MSRSMSVNAPVMSDTLTEITPRAYWHRSFPRVSVTVWNVKTGTDSIDGVCGVYVNADRNTATLVGREGAVRLTTGDKIVSVIRSATGSAEWQHPLDTAGSFINGGQ